MMNSYICNLLKNFLKIEIPDVENFHKIEKAGLSELEPVCKLVIYGRLQISITVVKNKCQILDYLSYIFVYIYCFVSYIISYVAEIL